MLKVGDTHNVGYGVKVAKFFQCPKSFRGGLLKTDMAVEKLLNLFLVRTVVDGGPCRDMARAPQADVDQLVTRTVERHCHKHHHTTPQGV